MSETIVVLIGSSPACGKAATNFSLLAQLVGSGHAVQVCLLQDGVLAGVNGGWANAARAQALDARFCVLDEDLALRGLGSQDLAPGVESMTYGELVETIMDNGIQVIGIL